MNVEPQTAKRTNAKTATSFAMMERLAMARMTLTQKANALPGGSA